MSLEFAKTKAGTSTLSTVNLPAPLKVTLVPLSMKMARAMSTPKWRRTGQSTNNVNAECLAAANARATPSVSSLVPSQLTQPAIDFSTVGGACASDPPVMPPVVEPAPVAPEPVEPPLPVVPPLVVPLVVPLVEDPPVAVLPLGVVPLLAPPPVAAPAVTPRLLPPLLVARSGVTPLRMIAPDTLAVSGTVPPSEPQAASETLITTLIAKRRENCRAPNSISNVVYSSKHSRTKTRVG